MPLTAPKLFSFRAPPEFRSPITADKRTKKLFNYFSKRFRSKIDDRFQNSVGKFTFQRRGDRIFDESLVFEYRKRNGKTGGVHVSVDRAEIVKSAFCPHAPQYIPPISVYKRNTQLFHRRPPFSRGARGETRTREGRMDSYYPHCCRPPWIASVPFSHFRLRMYSYPRLFRSGGGRLFDGGKNPIDPLFPIF